MKFFLKTVLPILLGVVLWNVMPGTVAKLIALGVAAAVISVPILRGKYGGQDTRGRMTSLMLTVAILSASTLPAPAEGRDWSPQGEDVAEVQLACGFWCMVAWGLGMGAVYDGAKGVFRWWLQEVLNQEFSVCDEDGGRQGLGAFLYGEGSGCMGLENFSIEGR
jgi:hypothetical protein